MSSYDYEFMLKFREIDYFKYMLWLNYDNSMCNIYKSMLSATLNQVEDLIEFNKKNEDKLSRQQEGVFTLEELANFDGKKGKPAYVAVGDKVYDVSFEATWGGASHFGLKAGKDLTEEFNACHKDSAILSKLKVVGELKK